MQISGGRNVRLSGCSGRTAAIQTKLRYYWLSARLPAALAPGANHNMTSSRCGGGDLVARQRRPTSAAFVGAGDATRCVLTVLLLLVAVAVRDAMADDYGMPTEVVEEWACHDTELRLTCGRLDASIAILEATYTPNCTGQPDDDACIHMDFKKLTRSFSASPRVDVHLSETEAGRQFLEALQRHRQQTDERLERERDERQQSDAFPLLSMTKTKRNSLRQTLEMLIVDYLRELTPGEQEASEQHRQRRAARQPDDFAPDLVDDDNADDDEAAKVSVHELRKIEIGSRNITVEPRRASDMRTTPTVGRMADCPAFRRRVTKLDQYELDKALMPDGNQDRELNIRRVLNHRCSGRNHCSFAFSADYPFSILWHDGHVRIKYICMSDFRLNKYCHERLHIDNEPEPMLQSSPEPEPESKGEPIAERRIGNDPSFHNLRIITGGALNPPDALTNDVRRNQSAAAAGRRWRPHELPAPSAATRVYSQDFRVLKIIPSAARNATGESNEIYLRVDPPASGTIAPPATTSTASPSTTEPSENSASDTVIETGTETTNNTMASYIENTTAITTETKTKDYPDKPTKSTIILPTINEPSQLPDLIDNEIPTNDIRATTSDPAVEIIGQDYKDEYEDGSYEDDTVETFGRMVVRTNRVRVHTSHQVASIARLPLRQGFLASTGYPKYYVGESNCSWTLLAPVGHRVRLTVLDLNLRVDPICRDVLEIVDQNNVIFSGCQELAKPMQIVSDSHAIEVRLRTTSRLAYPKRGVLLHYTAMGCLLLRAPANGRLVRTARDTAAYACDARFVFADTGTSSRQLHCTEHYTWDKALPDCIPEHLLDDNPPLQSHRFAAVDRRHNHTLSVKPNAHNHFANVTRMADKTTDMWYDVAIPSAIICGLFLVNAAVFVVIMRYRNKRKLDNEYASHEMSRL